MLSEKEKKIFKKKKKVYAIDCSSQLNLLYKVSWQTNKGEKQLNVALLHSSNLGIFLA